jgi:alpha-amylase/alpha-mannosidase (GH57 family)
MIKKIIAIIFVLSIFSEIFIIQQFYSQTEINVNFNVTSQGYVTVYLSGIPSSQTLILHYGIENGPQQSWTQVFNKQMTWNGNNFSVTIGPFSNNTWIAWVFYDNSTGTWINYDNHAFWNWNLLVNPSNVGETYATVLPNGTILITAIGRAPDSFDIHYGLTTGPQTGLPWSNITDKLMTYDPLYGNYTITIGPFKAGQWIQWVYHDLTTNTWYSNNGKNFAIQDIYSPVRITSINYTRFVYISGQTLGIKISLFSGFSTAQNITMTLALNGKNYSFNTILNPGNNSKLIQISQNLPQGIYYPQIIGLNNGEILFNTPLPPLYILNTTGKKPISLVIVWNMHQPLYIEPNGTWEQPWVPLHTGQDFMWNGSLVGSYELQALLINKYNVSVTIDFTPVLLYQWETLLHEKEFKYGGTIPVNISHDLQAINFTLNLYKKLAKEGKLEVLTVPFYHPLMAIEYDNGWVSDMLAQILMGKNFTNYVFGLNASGAWTPEMAFNMGLIHLYNEANISFTILDQQAFLPYATLVSGSLNPDQPFKVEDSLGNSIFVLFRNTTLSNEFGFQFFSQSPYLTEEELIHQLATIYMNNPGGVVVVALDGENPLIFNPVTGPYDLNAIYSAISQYEGSWLVSQTASQAISSHNYSIITNLPENSWDLNLDYWNNGYYGKQEIWRNVSEAREYLVSLTVALGDQISPVVWTSPYKTPNSTNLIDTLWNYLYVAEGSDWTWQTGPPANGPSWFKAQALVYTSSIVNTVKKLMDNITLVSFHANHKFAIIKIRNNLPYKFSLILVINNGTYNTSQNIILHHGLNVIKIRVKSNSENYTIYLFSPVNYNELGATVIPITHYGFMMKEFNYDKQQNGNQNLETPLGVALAIIMVLAILVVYTKLTHKS